jgi:hypothetical protein
MAGRSCREATEGFRWHGGGCRKSAWRARDGGTVAAAKRLEASAQGFNPGFTSPPTRPPS